MNKKYIILFLVILLAVGSYITVIGNKKITNENVNVNSAQIFDGKNSTFSINSSDITLKNGLSEIEIASSSASKIITRYFGNEAYGDLNGDRLPDTAFLISQETGGSGIFYYVVVALKTGMGYKTTNAFFIGDRIAPQTTEIHSDSQELYVNFAERKPGEPFTTQPSQGVTLYLKVTSDGVLEGLMK